MPARFLALIFVLCPLGMVTSCTQQQAAPAVTKQAADAPAKPEEPSKPVEPEVVDAANAKVPEEKLADSCAVNLLAEDEKSVTLLAAPKRSAKQFTLRIPNADVSSDYLTLNVLGFSADANFVEVEVVAVEFEDAGPATRKGWMRVQDLPVIQSVLDKSPMADDYADTLQDHGLVATYDQPSEASAKQRLKTSALKGYRPFACQGRWLGMRKIQAAVWISSFCSDPYTMCP